VTLVNLCKQKFSFVHLYYRTVTETRGNHDEDNVTMNTLTIAAVATGTDDDIKHE